MPINFMRRNMHRVIVSIGFAIAVAVAWPVTAQTGGVMAGTAPGKAGVAQTVKLTATITAIYKATREVTLKGPEGKEVTVAVGPDVKNFSSLKIGDQVDAQYVEAVTLELKKGGGQKVERTEQTAVKGANPGEQPAGVAGRQVTIVADVVDLDPAKQTVTLRGPNRTVVLAISDPEQFKRIAKGDQVEAKYTQAFAIAVEPAAKK
jgi:Cu/Ag efflux protein CusF